MRVIAGQYRRRVLVAPPGLGTRPTSDRLRETLFNVLAARMAGRMDGARMLDLYAGSGAVGIEALSRGAARVDFVERAAGALGALQKNLGALGISSGFKVHGCGVGAALRKMDGVFDLVFLDPPYDAADEYAGTLGLLGGASAGLLAEGAVVVAEHRRRDGLAERYGGLKRVRVLEQGDAGLSFYGVATVGGE